MRARRSHLLLLIQTFPKQQENSGITKPRAPNTSVNAQAGNKQNAPHDVTSGEALDAQEKYSRQMYGDVKGGMALLNSYFSEHHFDADPYSTDPVEITRGKYMPILQQKMEALMLGLRLDNPNMDPGRLFSRAQIMLPFWENPNGDDSNSANALQPPAELLAAFKKGEKVTQQVKRVTDQIAQENKSDYEPGSPRGIAMAENLAELHDYLTEYVIRSPGISDKYLYVVATGHMNSNFQPGGNNPYNQSEKAPELPGDAFPKDVNVGGDNYYLVTQTPRQLYGDDQALKARALKDPDSLGVTPVQLDGETVYLPKGEGDNDAYLDRLSHDKIKNMSDHVGNWRDGLAMGGAVSAEVPPLAILEEGGAGALELVKLLLDAAALSKSEHPWGEAASMAAGKGLSKLGKYTVNLLGLGENHPGLEKLLSILADSGGNTVGEGGVNMLVNDRAQNRLSASEPARRNKQHMDANEHHSKANNQTR